MSTDGVFFSYGYKTTNDGWVFMEPKNYTSLYSYLKTTYYGIKAPYNNIDLNIFDEVKSFFVRKVYDLSIMELYLANADWDDFKQIYGNGFDRDPWNRQFIGFPTSFNRKLEDVAAVEIQKNLHHGVHTYYLLKYFKNDPQTSQYQHPVIMGGYIYLYVTTIHQTKVYCVDVFPRV